MRRSTLLVPLCFVTAVIAGCGNKGPLYMPPAIPAAPKPAVAAVPAHISTAAEPAHLASVEIPAHASSVDTPASGASSAKPDGNQ
jgi:predicted small lipoprotein YifL